MLKDIQPKAGIFLMGLLLLIAAATVAQTETQSYLPVALRQDIFFAGTEEREPNNSFAEANGALRPNLVYSALPDDADDYFFFVTEETGAITVSVLGLNISEGAVSLYREVPGAAPELVETADVPPDFLLEVRHNDAGKYYVLVHVSSAEPPPRPRNNTPYTLEISYLSLVTPTPDPEETPHVTDVPSPTATESPTRVGTSPTPTLEATPRPTGGASPTPTEAPTRGGNATSTPTATGNPEPTDEATPTRSDLIPAFEDESFEDGGVEWEQSSSSGRDLILRDTDTPIEAHTGEWVAWLGGEAGEVSRLGQMIEIPEDAGSFYLVHYAIRESDEEECDPESDSIEIHINGEMVSRESLCDATNQANWRSRDWAEPDFGPYAGQTIFLEIVVINNDMAGSVSSVFIDDVFFSQ